MVALAGHASYMPAFTALWLITSLRFLDVSAAPVRSGARATPSNSLAQPPMLSLPDHKADEHASIRKINVSENKFRHKQKTVTSHRRSILIPNEGNSFYVVPKARDYNERDQRVLKARSANKLRRCLSRRQAASANGLPGTIDIMAYSNSSTGWKLASLQIAPSGSKTNSSLILNASNSTRPAEFNLVNDDDETVYVQSLVYDGSTDNVTPFCASYDPSPPEPKPMTLEPCQPSSGNEPDSTGLSQRFRYDMFTGEITPMWTAGTDNGSSPDAPNAKNASDLSNGNFGNERASLNRANLNAPANQTFQSMQQKIAMVFTPSIPTYYESVGGPETGSDGSPGNPTASATSTVASPSVSMPPQAVTITMSTVTTGDPSTISSLGSTSNAASAEETMAGALNVDVVGPNATPSLEGPPETAKGATATPSPTATSLNAEQIAASIAGDTPRVTPTISTAAMPSTPTPAA